MSQEFNFVKVMNREKIINDLGSSSLNTLINSIEYVGNKLTVTTHRHLTPKEEELLSNIVKMHNPAEVVIRQRIENAMVFGRELVVEFATENALLGFTVDDIQRIIFKLANVKALLESGSLYAALTALQQIKPDNLLPQSRIDKYIKKVKAYLGEP